MRFLRHHRRLAHWTTLVALVLAALAPGISRALAHAQGVLGPWSPVCSVDPRTPSERQAPGGPRAVVDHCLLCTLAGDAPALPGTDAAPPVRVVAPPVRAAAALPQPDAAAAWPSAQPRAPPAAA